MTNNLFKIKNLTRAFGDRIVLNVPELTLPRGEIICIVGESGCGKTTFLELLGLMTNPQKDDIGYSDNTIELNIDNQNFNYRNDLWFSDEKSAEVRRNNFSFLFQQANLLPTLNVQENVVLPAIIKDVNEAQNKTSSLNDVFEYVQMTHRKDYETYKLSVGQTQRTAFARSVYREHSVLFADEPTGNLDPNNARIVFDFISDYIKTNTENTAIIVTHDIEMALEFSDRIAAVSRDGFCDNSNVFYKNDEQWFYSNHKKIESVRDKISTIIKKDREEAEKISELDCEPPKIKEFEKFFGEKYKEDFSLFKKDTKKKIKFNFHAFLILLILFSGILAIGFANGSLTDLAAKMADPFVNWLDMELTDKYRYQPQLVLDSLNTNENHEQFNISEISRFSQFSILIRDHTLKGSRFIKGRTIDLDDKVLNKLISSNFLLKGKGFNNIKDIGLIVSQDFFKKFGYDENALFIDLVYDARDVGERIVPIPIKGVVRELPGDNLFLATDYFKYELYHSTNYPQPFNPVRTERLLLFSPITENEAFTICDSLDKYFQDRITDRFSASFISDPQIYNESYKNGYFIPISFNHKLSIDEIDSVYSIISNSDNFNKYKFRQFYRTNFDNRSKTDFVHDRLSINLTSIDNVFALKEYLQSGYNINLDVARVELLKNFNMVKTITITLSWTIILFAIFSVNVFIFFYLYINLYKQRVHLGSLKAFGMTIRRLQHFYITNMMIFLTKISVIALILASVCGYSGLLKTVWVFITGINSESSYFALIDFTNILDIKNLSFPIFILFLFVGAYYSIKLAGYRILRHSPGDLVKDRIE